MFDADPMAQRALGGRGDALTPAQRREFGDLFADVLAGTLGARLERHAVRDVAVLNESIDGDLATVQARFRAEDGDQTVEARMARRDGRWRIFDIVLGPVSVIDLCRAQFDRSSARFPARSCSGG
jgi:ABC-type transporter MlaC component